MCGPPTNEKADSCHCSSLWASRGTHLSGVARSRYADRVDRELIDTHPHLADFLPFLDTLNRESARGAVLVACSFLDNQLVKILEAFLRPGRPTGQLLSGFNAPLGTLSSRAAAAYALGLLTEREFSELEQLRKVRNAFAHSVNASFDDEAIVKRCAHLTFAAKPYEGVEVNARGQFTTSAVALIMNLTNRAHYASKQQRQEQTWPY